MDKPLVWLHGEVRSPPLSKAARLEAGVLLRRLQRGELVGMPHARAMPSVGAGCHELRIVDAGASWRIVVRVDADVVMVAEVFRKTTRRTPRAVLEVCRRRLRLYDAAVRGGGGLDA